MEEGVVAPATASEWDHDAPTFRSLLPHEPLPKEKHGYILVQGGFEPKRIRAQEVNQSGKAQVPSTDEAYYWTKTGLEEALKMLFLSNQQIANHLAGSISRDSLRSVTVPEDRSSPPFTKVRLSYSSPLAALHVVQACRSQKISPEHLFSSQGGKLQFTSRPLQLTPLTTCPFLPMDVSWRQSNPPKFRRLICRPGETVEWVQLERQSTRFVFISGLVDNISQTGTSDLKASWWSHPRYVGEAIRRQLNSYDTSGLGVEVFVSIKQKKTSGFCYVGMRSPNDARAVIIGLQGKIIQWQIDWFKDATTVKSEKLFLDYAAVTNRSNTKPLPRGTGESGNIKGEKSRPDCTSTTKDVLVPGLVLIPDFVSSQEEEVIMAALTGPNAPWAPSQTNFSQTGAVKRKIQHYGYVFDYETANVLRDRSQPGADCPPLPDLPAGVRREAKNTEKLESYFELCVSEGRGWEALACLLERTRQKGINVGTDYPTDGTSTEIKYFRDLNQITVNSYEPGEGIGSHVDTPSAFSDGIISISLNGGVVMEFRKQSSESKLKKLVYLPPRSLLLMSGPARFEWEHMIVTRMTDTHNGKVLPRSRRVSLTVRTAIDQWGNPMPKVTTRAFPPSWGGWENNQDNMSLSKTGQNALVTPSVERNNVHAFYDAIAAQWHHTRGKRGVLWPGATQFLVELPEGSIVADVGCGDMKYLPAVIRSGSYVIGTDISLPLLEQASSAYSGEPMESSVPESREMSDHRYHLGRRPAVAVADCMNIPLRTKSCDAAICIAVMHHLSTRERRLRCIEELCRIVKVGGFINIQAWAMEQQEGSRRKFACADVFVPFNAQPKYLGQVGTSSQPKSCDNALGANKKKSLAQVYSEEFDADFDEKKGLVVFKRYCHLYRLGELEEIVSRIDSVSLHQSGYESGNHFVILKVVK